MNLKYCRTVVLILNVLLLILIIPPTIFGSNYNSEYTYHIKFGRITISHRLYTSVSSSLYDYYFRKSHNIYNYQDYAKFVTPSVFNSFAENIQNSTPSSSYHDEIFANAVLDIVHQISYTTSKVKYPVETLVDNSGDCDGLSILAASIMKAGDLDAVLFYYPTSPVSHMNVGVHISHEPIFSTQGAKPAYYEYNGTKYYIAETTSGADWKVGDQSWSFANIEPQIISLENCEYESPGGISSSLGDPLPASAISLNLIPESSNVSEWENAVTIAGSILPEYADQRITIYITRESSQDDIFRTVTTDEFGNYSLLWNFNVSGTFTIHSSWNGVDNYSGSDSEKLTVHVGLNQLLGKYEIVKSWWIGSEVVQVSTLSVAGYSILSNQRVIYFLEKNFTGSGVLLSSEFIILGNEDQNSSEQTITIPSYEQTQRAFRGRHKFTITVPEKTILIPDYEQQLNNHLEFTVRQNGEKNYSVSVRLLDNSDIHQIVNSEVSFVNASTYVKKNMWYNMEAHISENQTISKLFAGNVTYLSQTAPINTTTDIREFRILIKYDPESIIVFKSLEAEIPEQPTQLVERRNPTFLDLFVPYIKMQLFELLMILTVVIPLLSYAKRRRKTRTGKSESKT